MQKIILLALACVINDLINSSFLTSVGKLFDLCSSSNDRCESVVTKPHKVKLKGKLFNQTLIPLKE
jgi:hypothetical protein